jgi:hypothetical protein
MPAARRAALWSPEALADRDRIWDYCIGLAGPDVNNSPVVHKSGSKYGTISVRFILERNFYRVQRQDDISFAEKSR